MSSDILADIFPDADPELAIPKSPGAPEIALAPTDQLLTGCILALERCLSLPLGAPLPV